ncbi:DegT/DnrJ/EryC1/StrS family aminotransferase [Parerythrobacter aurantius]|uniref:DegT/DnrJ/EryC1/StrS family aminotransferase n=1 Tax=Parerythrobacter aurantius TaxID=3127706 RepID=UPI00325603A9
MMQIAGTIRPIVSIEPELPPAVISTWPRHEDDEIAAALKVLQSGRVNSLVHGDETRAFEHEFADYVGVPHAIAVANGTVSIELALRALGIGPGDEVIVPARSFFATTSAVVAVGALPVFADVEPATQNIDPDSVIRMISADTRAIICVHLAGQPCDMDRLCAVASANGLFLVEDCAQAHGAKWGGRPVGSFGDAGSFSFCTDKIISTGGEGGMLVLKDDAAWQRAWAYKDHGKNPHRLTGQGNGPAGEYRFLHDSFGSNFRITEVQAAIGRRQLAKLDEWIAIRDKNAGALLGEASRHPAVKLIPLPEAARHAYYKCYIRLDLDKLPAGVSRADIIGALQANGIQCGSGSCPDMSREKAFDGLKIRRDGNLSNAARLAKETIMFQVDHTLDDARTAWFGRSLADALNRVSRHGALA